MVRAYLHSQPSLHLPRIQSMSVRDYRNIHEVFQHSTSGYTFLSQCTQPVHMHVDYLLITIDATVNLTVKSLKPSLSLPITVSLTDSVAQLKSLISQASTSAPSADSQRLLLKGKALTDSKLLKEYDISDGAIVHLYFKPATAAAPTPALNLESTSASASTSTPPVDKSTSAPPSPAPPALTITTSVEDGPGTSMPLTNFDLAAPPTGPQPEITSATFHASIADPVFWQKIHALCVTEFEHGDEADLAWEHFLRAMKGKLSAGEAAKIRDVVGVRGEFPISRW